MTDIVCIGVSIVDCVIKGFDPEPLCERRFFSDSVELAPGGEAVNQSVSAAKLGLAAKAVCGIGTDRAAGILISELKNSNVDVSSVVSDSSIRTPVTVMFVDDTGKRKSITCRAHRHNFRPDRNLSFLDDAEAISLGSLFRAPFNNRETVHSILSEAEKRGITTYVDTKMPNDTPMTLGDFNHSLKYIDYIFPNEDEAKLYSGKTDPEEMADVFLDYGIKNVIVKLGEKGCFFKNADEKYMIPAFSVNSVDATGAGDNFIAGFITARHEKRSIYDSLVFASACGAVSTTAVGATSGLVNRKQIENFLKTQSTR